MKQATKVGLSGGVIVSLLTLAITYLPVGETIQGMGRMFMLLIIIASSFIAIRRTRDFELDGVITFSQGVKAGTKNSVFVALLLGFTLFIMQNYITDPYLALKQVDQVTKRKISETPSLLLEGASVKSIIAYLTFFSIMNIFLGFFASAAASIMLKRGPAKEKK